MMKNKIFITTLVSLIANSSIAQTQLPPDTFKVVKEYEPTLIDVNKINFDPVIDDDLKIELDLNYSFISKQLPVKFQVEPILSAKIKGEPLVKLYNGYARLGVGNALLPFGELYYNNSRSKEYSFGGHVRYYNMAEVNNIEGIDNQYLHAELFGKRFWKRNTLSSTISFDRQNFNYYGYYKLDNPQNRVELQKQDLEQYYNRFSAQVALKTTKQDSFNLRYSGDIRYELTTNAMNHQENNVVLNANLSQFKNSELYNLDILVDYNQYQFNKNSTIIGIKPQVSTIGEKFRINAGLGIFIDADSQADFHFYPIAEIKYNVIDNILVPYIGINGEKRRVNYASITKENLFVANDIELRNTNEKFNLYAGVRGTLSKKLSFNLSGSFKRTTDDYLFVQVTDTNRALSKVYYAVYDEIDELNFKGEMAYQVNEKITLYGQANYFIFETIDQAEAWHRPDVKASISGAYNLRNKIILKTDLIFWGEQFARGEANLDVNNTIIDYNVVKLKSIFDANLNVEYRYTKRLSAFVQFNNIGGINFEKYKDYPTQGFNVWGGLTYAF
ncbi:hypothetical protein OAD50_04140 [Vicingaceae bacterium]|nr:hypothetical protein [Vicingaceae bacterium]